MGRSWFRYTPTGPLKFLFSFHCKCRTRFKPSDEQRPTTTKEKSFVNNPHVNDLLLFCLAHFPTQEHLHTFTPALLSFLPLICLMSFGGKSNEGANPIYLYFYAFLFHSFLLLSSVNVGLSYFTYFSLFHLFYSVVSQTDLQNSQWL